MNFLTSVDLLSFLNLVKQNNLAEIKNILSDYPEILKILELLGVLSIISSDLPLNIELTPLGSIILSNEDIKSSLQEHDKMLHSISTDIQRIKSSLSTISLDVVRSQGLAQDSTYGSDFLLEKEQNFKRDSSIKQPESNSSNFSNRIKSINIDDLRTYVSEVQENLSPQELNQLNRSINRIKSTYGNTTSFIQQGKFQEFGIESFLVIDSIFIVLLKIFNQKLYKGARYIQKWDEHYGILLFLIHLYYNSKHVE